MAAANANANWQTGIEIGDGMRLRAWCAGDLESLLLHANDEQVSRGTDERFLSACTRAATRDMHDAD